MAEEGCQFVQKIFSVGMLVNCEQCFSTVDMDRLAPETLTVKVTVCRICQARGEGDLCASDRENMSWSEQACMRNSCLVLG